MILQEYKNPVDCKKLTVQSYLSIVYDLYDTCTNTLKTVVYTPKLSIILN